jgi:hypothetical protein
MQKMTAKTTAKRRNIKDKATTKADPFRDDKQKNNGNGKSKDNGVGAGRRLTSHPSQRARWMGHPAFVANVLTKARVGRSSTRCQLK